MNKQSKEDTPQPDIPALVDWLLVAGDDASEGLMNWLRSGGRELPEYPTKLPHHLYPELECGVTIMEMKGIIDCADHEYGELTVSLKKMMNTWMRLEKKRQELEGKHGCDVERSEIAKSPSRNLLSPENQL